MEKIYKLLLGTIGKWLPISYHPGGRIGRYFREFCAKKIVKSIGHGCNIEKGAVLQHSIKIGNNSGIGVNCVIGPGTIIGNGVMMGPDCLIYTHNHKFDKDLLRYNGDTEINPVNIEDNVWIGARCIILPGVTVGKGSTIGAGAIVTKNVPEYTVVAGNPAKVVKRLID